MFTLELNRASAADALGRIGADFARRGWAPATSGNYSCVLPERGQLLITASGRHKGHLGPDDFVLLEPDGTPAEPDAAASSAETALHLELVRTAGAGAVLHTHSIWGTVLSEYWSHRGSVELSGWEVLKALPGFETHESAFRLVIFDNTQDITDLAGRVRARLLDPAHPLRHGLLLRGHGLYAWGADLAAAHRHIEALEFLLEVVGRLQSLDQRA